MKIVVSMSCLAFALLTAPGCSGSGRIYCITTSVKKLSQRGPLFVEMSADRCHHWLDEAGRLRIAMSGENTSIIGDAGKRVLNASLVLGLPPQDNARNYHVTRDTLRVRLRKGYNHQRWASYGGIVAVWKHGAKGYRGRFRVRANQQSFLITTGWTGNQRVILTGEFTSTEDPARGRLILERTESPGMERPIEP